MTLHHPGLLNLVATLVSAAVAIGLSILVLFGLLAGHQGKTFDDIHGEGL